MLSRQHWVEVCGAATGRPRAPKTQSPWALPEKIFLKLIAGNAFSKHFRCFLVTLKERVIPRKRRGELDSDPKMNQTERWLPVHEQPRSAVAGSSESTCDQLGCSPNKIIFHSRQMQTCPTTYRWDDTLPHPHFQKFLSKWLFSQFQAIFIFSCFHLCRSESRSAENAFAVRIVDCGALFVKVHRVWFLSVKNRPSYLLPEILQWKLQQQPFNGRLSGTTWVRRYQKKHSPAHTHPGQRTSFITFLHLHGHRTEALAH